MFPPQMRRRILSSVSTGSTGWGTPTSIYSPRFVRLNFTINY